MPMIQVVGVYESSALPCVIEFDHHIPLTFETQESIPGARDIQLGNIRTSLLELGVPQDSMELKRVVVVAVDHRATRALAGTTEGFRSGLPILKLGENQNFAGNMPTVHIDMGFAIYEERNFAEIAIGGAATFDGGMTHGRISFLTSGDQLVGMRITQLSDDEAASLSRHLAQIPRQR